MKRLNKMRLTAIFVTLLMVVMMAKPTVVMAAEETVDLGTTSGFAVLAGETITNTGTTTIMGSVGGNVGGDVGLHPGSAFTDQANVSISGDVHIRNPIAIKAKTDLETAYDDAAGRNTTETIGTELGGKTVKSGVYESESGAFKITGTLTLDAENNPEAVFIFKTASTLITASGSNVKLINGALFCRTFWKVGSSATLGTNSYFVGHIFALTSIAAKTGAKVQGQLLARNGEVTLDSNTITNGICEVTPEIATLNIIKKVVNANGGTKVASDFQLHVKTSGKDVVASPAPGSESGKTYTLVAGVYEISEENLPGYTVGYSKNVDSTGKITLAPGENKTVIITNTYKPTTIPAPTKATLKVIKHVIGGTKVASDFDINVKTSGKDVVASPAPGSESGKIYTLDPGDYVISEDDSSEYTAKYSGNGDSTGKITLEPGQNKTVTITNTYTPEGTEAPAKATLHVIKHVVNDNGGTKKSSDFKLYVKSDGNDDIEISAPGAEKPGKSYTLDAGTYIVSEGDIDGYKASYNGSDSSGKITLVAGDNKTVTITNDDIEPVSTDNGSEEEQPEVVTPEVDDTTEGTPDASDTTVVTPAVPVKTTVTGGTLPNTSTNLYKLLIMGAALTMLGALGWISKKRFE